MLKAVQSNHSCPKRSVLLAIPEGAQGQEPSNPQVRLFCVLSLANKIGLKIEQICWLSHTAAHFRGCLEDKTVEGNVKTSNSETPKICQFTNITVKSFSSQLQCLSYACIIRTSFLALRHFPYIYYVYTALPKTPPFPSPTSQITMAAQFPVPVTNR